jgi:hypothetical protein
MSLAPRARAEVTTIPHTTLKREATKTIAPSEGEGNILSAEGLLRGIVISALLWAMLMLIFV